MKQLSIEEKAKRYDEAIEKARKLKDEYNDIEGYYPNQWLCEELFPELKESEDERTWIINYLSNRELNSSIIAEKENLKKTIAWLEKHKYTEDDLDKAYKCADEVQYRRGYEDAKKEIEKQGKNNMGISEATKQKLEDNLNKALEKETPESWNEFIEKQGEQKPAWSEEDEKYNNIVVSALYNPSIEGLYNFHKINRSDVITWLKSLKGRVQPQPKQKWNSGDEAHLHSLITHLEQWVESNPDTTGADIQGENVAWLKSLKSQSQWKPSDEQMKVLQWCLPLWAEPKSKAILKSLINDLKKLREE